ncbi:MAG: beta-propeller domain-containing protein [Myxococcales bacterium]|nr:beta-propeller domain-containing protein [Myxococcales bacterium]
MKRIYWLVGMILWTVGCSNTKEQPVGAERAQLTRFQSCEELEAHVKRVAISEMEAALDGFQNNDNRMFDAGVAENQPTNPPQADAAAGPDFSKTNTQEKDVDEADIVKTDGYFVYVLSGGFLTVIRSVYEADELQEVARIAIEGAPIEMFVHGTDPSRHDAASPTKAVVFSQVFGEGIPVPLRRTGAVGNVACPLVDGGFGCGYQNPVVKLTVLDLADRANPKLELEVYSEANYMTSRLVNNTVHAVVSSATQGPELRMYPEVDFNTYDNGQMTFQDKMTLAAEINRLKAENRARIDATPIEDWLPKSYRVEHKSDGETVTSGLIASCEAFYKPAVLNGREVIDIFSLGLEEPLTSLNHSAIVSHGGVVYASTESLYLATHPWYSSFGWNSRSDALQKEESLVHKFDIGADSARAVYVASGTVEGHVLNQFSMDEEQGRLRVATTTGSRWGIGGQEAPSKNHLFVLGQVGEELAIEGQVRDLAPGEQIYSARFEGDLGFLVTFRQVDPLFVFDLSLPQPVKVAELKIPGFSTYMHPLYDEGSLTHLLTIGQGIKNSAALPICGKDALNGIEEGSIDGLQLSVFDVRDLGNPCLVQTQYVGGYSEAQYNHKAFSYFEEHKLLAIPVTQWGEWTENGFSNDSFSGLKVFHVDAETGIEHLSDIEHTPSYANNDEDLGFFQYEWWTQVQRSLTIDDHLYSISGRAVYATPLSALGHEPLVNTSSILLPDPQPSYWPMGALD